MAEPKETTIDCRGCRLLLRRAGQGRAAALPPRRDGFSGLAAVLPETVGPLRGAGAGPSEFRPFDPARLARRGRRPCLFLSRSHRCAEARRRPSGRPFDGRLDRARAGGALVGAAQEPHAHRRRRHPHQGQADRRPAGHGPRGAADPRRRRSRAARGAARHAAHARAAADDGAEPRGRGAARLAAALLQSASAQMAAPRHRADPHRLGRPRRHHPAGLRRGIRSRSSPARR